MEDQLPFSAAAENNKEPILGVLREWFKSGEVALEIGSGTGQHVQHFASGIEAVTWIPSETVESMPALLPRLNHRRMPNIKPPIELDVTSYHWNGPEVDHVFSANTAHIMSWDAVCSMFAGIPVILRAGVFALYGPFNRNGAYTSAGNRSFDMSLRSRDPAMGIRNDADLDGLARRAGLTRVGDVAMPANNRILIWRRADAPECGRPEPA